MEVECNDLSPDMLWRCPLELGHAGAHENWHGSWFEGKWLTHIPQEQKR
jgi:hypothetical protein